MCVSRAGRDGLRGVRLALPALGFALLACHGAAPVVVPIADGAVIAPEGHPERYAPRLLAAGARRLLVPWTTATTDVAAIAEAARGSNLELVIGLTPTRRASEVGLRPRQPEMEIDAALERALAAGDALSAIHLDHLERGVPDTDFAAYLTAVRARVAARTPLPLSVAIPASPTAFDRVARATGTQSGETWPAAWAKALAGRADRVLIVVDDPSIDLERLGTELGELRRRLGDQIVLSVSVESRATIAPSPRLGGAAIAPGRARADVERAVRILRTEVDFVLVAGLEAFEPDAIFGPEVETRAIADARPELEAQARALARRVRRGFIREGQVLGRIDASEALDRGANLRPDGTVDLTGAWTAAAALRFATTREPEARADAREAWRGLHALAHVTPVRGEVARAFSRVLDSAADLTGTGTTARWTRAPDRELYFVSPASPGELASWFLGAAAHHALTADEGERAEIVSDVKTILDEILARTSASGATTAVTPDLAEAPLERLAIFQAGAALTGETRHTEERDRLLADQRVITRAADRLADALGGEPDLGDVAATYLLLAFETDAPRRARLEPILEAMSARRRRAGDALADVVTAVFRPGLDGGRRAVGELVHFEPAFLDNAAWLAARFPADGGPFVPIERRPAGRVDFDVTPPFGAQLVGGLEDRFPGVTFLLAYWMGRHHAVTTLGP